MLLQITVIQHVCGNEGNYIKAIDWDEEKVGGEEGGMKGK